MAGEVSFPDGAKLSANAKDFITQLLTLDPKKRPSADRCLKHAFIMNFSQSLPVKSLETQDNCVTEELPIKGTRKDSEGAEEDDLQRAETYGNDYEFAIRHH